MPTWRLQKGNTSPYLHQLGEFLCPQELRIVSVLDNAAVSAEQVRIASEMEVRTEKVLNAIDALGKQLGYEVRSHYSQSEWLLDAVWFIKRPAPWLPFEFPKKPEWATFEGLKLACESEWKGDPNEVLQDFAKLTVVNADFRLFVHSNQYYNGHVNTVDICKSILNYSSGARYIFVGFDKGKQEFRIDFVNA